MVTYARLHCESSEDPLKIRQDVCADPDNFRAQNWWMYVSQSRQLCTPCRGLCQCPDNFGGDPGRKYGCSLLLMGIILRCIGSQVGGWVTWWCSGAQIAFGEIFWKFCYVCDGIQTISPTWLRSVSESEQYPWCCSKIFVSRQFLFGLTQTSWWGPVLFLLSNCL